MVRSATEVGPSDVEDFPKLKSVLAYALVLFPSVRPVSVVGGAAALVIA